MKIEDLNNTLDISRDNLPQIDFSTIDEIIPALENSFEIKYGKVPCNQLLPIQDKLNMDKVNSMIEDEVYLEERRIFISKEGYIIDGHHYWAANLEKNPEKKIDVYLIMSNVVDLINWFNSSNYVENKSITEGKII